MRRQRKRIWGGQQLETRQVLDSTLVFNEVLYNPTNPTADAKYEFVELFNQMGVDLDISNWRLADGIDFRFAAGTIVPSGGYLVIAKDPAALQTQTGQVALGPYEGQLSDAGERLELRDRNERLMDWMEYGDSSPWPLEADGLGPSLAKRQRLKLSSEPENWVSSVVIGGTPGRANFADQVTKAAQETVRTLAGWNDSWRVDSSGQDRGTTWKEVNGPADFGSAANGVFYAGSARRADAVPTLVTGVTAKASSELPGALASHVVDGSGLQPNGSHVNADAVNTMWQSNGTFFGVQDTDPEITFDLGKDRVLADMRLWNYNGVDTATCCLDRGIARTDVLVAGENGIFAKKIDDLNLNKAPGTVTDFSQTISLDGTTGRFVKLDVDTTNGVANFGAPFNFVGLSEVQFRAYPAAGDTVLPLGPTTHYFRREFDFNDAADRTSLSMSLLVDDGAVVYLNGTEVYRKNLPTGEIRYNTLASTAVGNAAIEPGITIPGSLLRSGKNVIGVEVHQAAAPDTDMVFGMELKSTTAPEGVLGPESMKIAFNEIGAAGSPDFFIEVANRDAAAVDLSGLQLAYETGFRYTFPAGTLLPAKGYLAVSSAVQKIPSEGGDWIGLYSADAKQLISAVTLRKVPQGRLPDATGAWMTERTVTPAAANQIVLHDEIVINEIMYNFRPDAAKPATPPTYARTTVLPFTSVWRYNESGEALPSDWYKATHPEGGKWKKGPGLIGFETNSVVAPGLNTLLTEAESLQITTAYFESEFNVTAQQLAENKQLFLRHIIDDGAVFYLNGVEVNRFSMPAGPVDSTTVASVSINNAAASDPIPLPMSALVAGTNRISVSVHQRSNTSNDLVFGAELVIAKPLDNGTPAEPFQKNDEEWIELFNRSDRTVDLTNWSLSRAIDYKFEAGTKMAPGEYLVIARDANALRQKFPDVAAKIVGNYSGQLSNTSELIRLLDDRGNPADEVRYFEDGQWPSAADGRGSSLELRDPFADNAYGLAWDASDELSRGTWKTYTYRGVAAKSAVGPDGRWQEFVMGLLSDGVVLLDNIRVVQDPGGAAINLIQNGTFEADTIGSTPAKWRSIGNHRHSPVIVDPDDPTNKVWRFVATGATEHMHNHAETTFKINNTVVQIQNGTEYEISYRAKWVTGTNLLNTRLYFNRLARSTPIEQPKHVGTPGRANSARVANLGPVYDKMIHSPVVPDAGQPVTVSVNVMDANQIKSAALWYSVQDGPWQKVDMLPTGGTRYAGTIPGQAASNIVQFYVEATDGLNASTTFPRLGRDSRALYKVQDGLAAKNALHNVRLVMTPADAAFMHTDVELMSNDGIGATIISNESEVFYDANVRLSGSQRARPFQPRLAFSIGFNSDQLFRDVHSSVTLDRSESTGFGQREHIYHHAMNQVGGLPSEYQDLFNIITPRKEHTGTAEGQLARYSDIFLDEQYENGSDGQLYEYELVYYPTTAKGNDPEGRKNPSPDEVVGSPIRFLGDDKENNRWTFLNKNNRQQDDYSQLIQFTKVMSLPNAEFVKQASTVLDVDQWLRAFALGANSGHGDNYLSDGSQHNLQMYIRPSDGRVLLFPHDLDAFFDVNRAIVGGDDLRRLIADPGNAHMYYGHVDDMIQTTFNADYMTRWTTYWKTLLPAQNFAQHLADLVKRSSNLNTAIVRAAPKVNFAITNAPTSVTTPTATVSGSGWVNVRELRLTGSSKPLPVKWTAVTAWQVEVPLTKGANAVSLEAYDFQGKLLGTVQTSIESTASNDLAAGLRITEVNYNPAAPTTAELALVPSASRSSFEFIELANTSNAAINLLGAQFTAGISLVFPSILLGPGEVAVIASQPNAFKARYGSNIRILGDMGDSNLSNSGEQIALADPNGKVLADFTYSDGKPWPTSADNGFTLSLMSPASVTGEKYNDPKQWTASERIGGSPGRLLLDGDLNLDGTKNALDINRLALAIRSSDVRFDLNASGVTDQEDLTHLVQQVFRTNFGDSNLDGRFDSADLVAVFQVGQYQDNVKGNSGWAEGDWNGDSDFDTSDFVLAFQAGGYVSTENGATALNPENVDWVAALLATDRKAKQA